MKIDHEAIIEQLNRLFQLMPKDKPRVVFCWSGGSLHVPHLPLAEAQAVIIVGGLSTNRFHKVHATQAHLWKQLLPYHKITLIEKPGGDHFLGINNQSGAATVGAETLRWLAEVIVA